jgi:hypothetical protein
MDPDSNGAISPAKLLAIYLNDHLTAATAGVELVKRAAGGQRDQARRTRLSQLASEVAADRASLLAVMRRLGVKPAPHRVALGWAAEKVGRLKTNGSVVQRSPLSDLIELEGMLLGVEGKACLWRSLQVVAVTDKRLDAHELDLLEERAAGQRSELESMRQSSAEVLRH